MLDMNALNKMSYFMDSEHPVLGWVSEYHIFINDRLAVKVLVQIEDEKAIGGDHPNCFPIWVATHNGETHAQRLEQHAVRKVDENTGKTRISSDSVKYAVLPHLLWVITELYIPKN